MKRKIDTYKPTELSYLPTSCPSLPRQSMPMRCLPVPDSPFRAEPLHAVIIRAYEEKSMPCHAMPLPASPVQSLPGPSSHLRSLPLPSKACLADPRHIKLQRLYLETSELRSPLTTPNTLPTNHHDLVQLAQVKHLWIVPNFHIKRPSIKEGAGSHDSVAINANRTCKAKSRIFPQLIYRLWAIVFDQRDARTECTRLNLFPQFQFAPSVQDESFKIFARHTYASIREIQRCIPFNLRHLFVVGVGLVPFGRDFFQGFRKRVEWVSRLPIVHNHGCDAYKSVFLGLIRHA